MVECLRAEGVSTVFGYPGAAICPFYDELRASDIRHILVRQEQNAAHAANGYARISGRPGVCIATSGPGATNLITGIATAYMDSIPLIAITGQVRSDQLGRDVFQEADITGATEPFNKHSYLVTNARDLPRIFKEAFHIASTGRPGPVLIDVPIDVQQQAVKTFSYPKSVDIMGYKPSVKGHVRQIERAVERIAQAERPVICAGGGVISAGAQKLLKKFAEQTSIPVVTTMMGIGALPSAHPLNLGMMGMYGVQAANRAFHETDLVLLVGARVGDRTVAAPDQLAKRADIIHIDIDPAEIGKNLKTDIPIVGDIAHVLEHLVDKVAYKCPDEWVQECIFFRKQERFEHREQSVNPKAFVWELSRQLPDNAIWVADVGQNQIWSANYAQVRKGRFLTSAGMGTMGYSIPAAIGAQLAAPEQTVCAVCGDGSFQMSMNELATACQHAAPIKVIVMRNTRLGMVRELQDRMYEGHVFATVLDGSPDFIKIAEAFGIPAMRVHNDREAPQAIERLLQESGPFLIECIVSPDEASL